MATDELTADILTADQIKYMLAGESCFPPEVRKLWDQNNLLRADRDRLREERDKWQTNHALLVDDYKDIQRDLAKLREEIAAKDAEIQRLKDNCAAWQTAHDKWFDWCDYDMEIEASKVAMRRLLDGAAPADEGKTCAPMEDWRGANDDWRKR